MNFSKSLYGAFYDSIVVRWTLDKRSLSDVSKIGISGDKTETTCHPRIKVVMSSPIRWTFQDILALHNERTRHDPPMPRALVVRVILYQSTERSIVFRLCRDIFDHLRWVMPLAEVIPSS